MFSSTEANYEVLACGGQVKRLCILQLCGSDLFTFIPESGSMIPMCPTRFVDSSLQVGQAPSSCGLDSRRR